MLSPAEKKFLLWITIFLILLLLLLISSSQRLQISVYPEKSHKLQAPLCIALITDLHGSHYGKGQEKLLQALEEQSPDIICISGDLLDEKRDPENSWELLKAVGEDYPCYYVSGNHEFRQGDIQAIKEKISSYGVKVLEGEGERLRIGGQTVYIAGVDDPSGLPSQGSRDGARTWQEQLDDAAAGRGGEYSILLSHRPERVSSYQQSGFDLTLCGHAHGGQVRIPGLLNGLYAPHQGFFPQYAGGQYQWEQGSMIVSRGLCKSWIPRIFNRPELVFIQVQPE